jgi:methionyl aminopeptidase
VARGEQVVPKTPAEIEAIRASGRIVAGALRAMAEIACPGMPTIALDRVGEDYVRSYGGSPSFKDYRPAGAPRAFPNAVCIAVNDVVVHGIPSDKVVLKEGDIVGLDIGVFHDGYHADGALTVEIGEVDERVRKLVRTTRAALEAAIEIARVGKRLSDISATVQKIVEGEPRARTGFRCLRDLSGHGIGKNVHEPPSVLNYLDRSAPDLPLEEGIVLAVEPMTSLGAAYTRVCPLDGWGARTADGAWSAHFEHTLAVGRERARVLTTLED